MRKSTLLWLVLTILCSAVLFKTSQRVTHINAQIDILKEKTQSEKESLRVLQAEWSYLNHPERLEKLSEKYLTLTPGGGQRFAKIEDVGKVAVVETQDSTGAEISKISGAAPKHMQSDLKAVKSVETKSRPAPQKPVLVKKENKPLQVQKKVIPKIEAKKKRFDNLIKDLGALP